MEDIKKYIIGYSIFSIIMLFFGIAQDTTLFENISTPTPSGLTSLINLAINIINTIATFLIFSTSITVINIILWGIRILFIMDLLIFGKRLLNPLSN